MSDAKYGVLKVQPPPRTPTVNCLIIGIGGWDQYTQPLAESIRQHEPMASITIIDNAGDPAYPLTEPDTAIARTERLCYSAAINRAKAISDERWGLPDWYLVLSNDVLCTGPFAALLGKVAAGALAGPHLATNTGWSYLEGWCVAVPRPVWGTLGGWDEAFQVSSWEDADFSACAVEAGYKLAHMPGLPFTHLDQRQRFNLVPNYWDSETHNAKHFLAKREKAHGLTA